MSDVLANLIARSAAPVTAVQPLNASLYAPDRSAIEPDALPIESEQFVAAPAPRTAPVTPPPPERRSGFSPVAIDRPAPNAEHPADRSARVAIAPLRPAPESSRAAPYRPPIIEQHREVVTPESRIAPPRPHPGDQPRELADPRLIDRLIDRALATTRRPNPEPSVPALIDSAVAIPVPVQEAPRDAAPVVERHEQVTRERLIERAVEPRTAETIPPPLPIVEPRPQLLPPLPETRARTVEIIREAATPAAPTIQVSIGRIEVRAAPPAPPTRAESARPVVMTLDEYLRRREGGAR